MVNETRVPSSSNSSSAGPVRSQYLIPGLCDFAPTNCHRLDPHSFLEMSIGCVVGVFGSEDLFSAEGVDKGCSTYLLSTHGLIKST